MAAALKKAARPKRANPNFEMMKDDAVMMTLAKRIAGGERMKKLAGEFGYSYTYFRHIVWLWAFDRRHALDKDVVRAARPLDLIRLVAAQG
jgi:hypothetical protein